MSLPKQKRLVLYADDDSDDLDLVKEAFAAHAGDIEVKTFPSAIALLGYLHTTDNIDLPCLIILDINMPKLGGKDALRLLRTLARYDTVPAILFTTSSLPMDHYFAQHYKAGFVTKPLGSDQMEVIVSALLKHCNEGRAGENLFRKQSGDLF